jgi:hypothetical protein
VRATNKQGDKHYDHSFVVQGFRFGAPGGAKRVSSYSQLTLGLAARRRSTQTSG